MTKEYRSLDSYLGRTEEARERQRENLLRGRAKRARHAEVKP